MFAQRRVDPTVGVEKNERRGNSGHDHDPSLHVSARSDMAAVYGKSDVQRDFAHG